MTSGSDISLWLETCEDDLTRRPALSGPTDVDVAIVGAGFTGLWTAYYLSRIDPTLRIAVLEREFAGFGASGRNGGWASALFPASRSALAHLPGASADGAKRLTDHMRASVDEVAKVSAEEGIDAHFHKGGTVSFARSPGQLERARADVAAARRWGDTEEDLRLLDADETRSIAQASEVLGGTFTPHCARIHPARLVRGLARAVERRGVRIYEGTAVRSIAPGRVETPMGTVRADAILRATEGYTPTLAGLEREVVPIYSLIVATEPLPESVWEQVGLADRPTFTDQRNLIIYGQRTADGRIVFGGRGAPYHFGSDIKGSYDVDERVFATLRRTLVDLFPALHGARFTHAWGGCLGVPRDWTASVGFDRRSGTGWAGGYVGDGVTTTNLAGRTLADLVTGQRSELVDLPWVNHRSPRWEPEPLRWLEINASFQVMRLADQEERATGRPSLIARGMSRFLGGH
ncbi:MAG TPA: FAD-binding oxidoreductase [Segeticoccus sp.]|uniref:NAD(P)/FAD-dependent oxidoreductase n=1 Tax=Segeticoccus sp. TaxID=2706531 RepID=UPI002D7FFCCC|nr:FAD-binding oxidoreductase [Segeticoccus sp.]HET8599062.1 FAD-binding oxidoreductase [Segeticoccus sp.]